VAVEELEELELLDELEELEAPELLLEFAAEIEEVADSPLLSLDAPPQPHSNRQAAAAAAPSSGKRRDDDMASGGWGSGSWALLIRRLPGRRKMSPRRDRRCGWSVARIVGGWRRLRRIERLVGNRMRAGEPGAQIDQAAAIAAEGPVRKLIGPLDRTLAGRTSQSLDHGER
jgi:hypothetical protein